MSALITAPQLRSWKMINTINKLQANAGFGMTRAGFIFFRKIVKEDAIFRVKFVHENSEIHILVFMDISMKLG